MYQPLKIHSLLKSGREICSLRTACVRVMKFFAWPDVPGILVKTTCEDRRSNPLNCIPFFFSFAILQNEMLLGGSILKICGKKFVR